MSALDHQQLRSGPHRYSPRAGLQLASLAAKCQYHPGHDDGHTNWLPTPLCLLSKSIVPRQAPNRGAGLEKALH